ncbi:uncharacterized protein [Solanum lycopersicum]|uniref:uncharacterized protein n=1 Tax=Solanum lycopersicum TaxID=4081 RepID=UPI0002BC85DF
MDAKPIDTPMGTNSKMDVDDSGPMVNEIVYRLIIGSLLNLMTISRQILCSVWALLLSLGELKSKTQWFFFTVEVEYVAVASCCAQLLWIKHQIEDFGVLSNTIPFICDNTSALNMAKNPVQHKRTKHTDV